MLNQTTCLSIGDHFPQNCWIGDPIPYYLPVIERHYHSYPIYTYLNSLENKSKVEEAFKIARGLVEKEIINPSTVGQFIEIVNIIVDIL